MRSSGVADGVPLADRTPRKHVSSDKADKEVEDEIDTDKQLEQATDPSVDHSLR